MKDRGSEIRREVLGDEHVDAALAGARPQKDNAFKIALAKRTLVRALTEVAA